MPMKMIHVHTSVLIVLRIFVVMNGVPGGGMLDELYSYPYMDQGGGAKQSR